MNIVKHLKNSNSPSLRKKRFRFGLNKELFATIIFGIFVATYLDLFFVGIGMYSFPTRPFSDIFSINLLFSMIFLPIYLFVYLSFITELNEWKRMLVILVLSVLAAVFEKVAEELGWFSHDDNWHHHYTLIGYCVYLHVLTFVYIWMIKRVR